MTRFILLVINAVSVAAAIYLFLLQPMQLLPLRLRIFTPLSLSQAPLEEGHIETLQPMKRLSYANQSHVEGLRRTGKEGSVPIPRPRPTELLSSS